MEYFHKSSILFTHSDDSLETVSDLSYVEDEIPNGSHSSVVTGFEGDPYFFKLSTPIQSSPDFSGGDEKHNRGLEIQSECNSKIELLLKANQDLEGQLHLANIVIGNLKSHQCNCHSSVALPPNTVFSSIAKLENEVEEYKVERVFKHKCIEELKTTICNLYVNIETVKQNNIKLTCDSSLLNSQIEALRKSELWYKEQINLCRLQNSTFYAQIVQLQQHLSSKDQYITNLQIEIDRLKLNFNKAQLNLSKERDNLQNTLSTIHKEITDKYMNLICTQNTNESINEFELAQEHLSQELLSIKNAWTNQQNFVNDINIRNSELNSKNAILEQALIEKEAVISKLQGEILKIDSELDRFDEKSKKQAACVRNLKRTVSELDIALEAACKDSKETKNVLTSIHININRIITSYLQLKHTLNVKLKELQELHTQIDPITSVNCLIANKNDQCDNEEYLRSITEIVSLLKNFNILIIDSNYPFCEVKNNLMANFSVFKENIERIAYFNDINNHSNYYCDESLQTNAILGQENLIELFRIIYHNFDTNEINRANGKMKPDQTLKLNNSYINLLLLGFNKVLAVHGERIEKRLTYDDPLQMKNLNHRIGTLKNQCDESHLQIIYYSKIIEHMGRNTIVGIPKHAVCEKIKCSKARQAKNLEQIPHSKRFDINTRTLPKPLNKQLLEPDNVDKEFHSVFNCVCNEVKHLKVDVTNENLEMKHISNILLCERCKEYELMKQRNMQLSLQIIKSQDRIKCCCEQLMKSNRMIHHLQERVDHLTSLENVVKIQVSKFDKMQQLLISKENSINNLESKHFETNTALTKFKMDILLLMNENDDLKVKLDNSKQCCCLLEENVELLTKELSTINCKNSHLNKELSHLLTENRCLENSWIKKENHLHSLLRAIQNENGILLKDLEEKERNKYFLQRLCNDLKFALHSSTRQIEVLKNQLQQLSNSSKAFISSSDLNNTHYDSELITCLLKYKGSSNSLNNLEDQVNSLKTKMTYLHNQVVQKLSN